MFTVDHLAISCERLDEGVAWAEATLGVRFGSGGQHPHFGTHNRLLSLGEREYLEVIAIDPAAQPPGYPRWFDLDRFEGAPRLTNWILACTDLDAALMRLGSSAGLPVPLSRGEYRWQMAVPPDGLLPQDNIHPAVIEWQGPHPGASLASSGCRLLELVVSHPDALQLRDRLSLNDARVAFRIGAPGLRATVETPGGVRVLQ